MTPREDNNTRVIWISVRINGYVMSYALGNITNMNMNMNRNRN